MVEANHILNHKVGVDHMFSVPLTALLYSSYSAHASWSCLPFAAFYDDDGYFNHDTFTMLFVVMFSVSFIHQLNRNWYGMVKVYKGENGWSQNWSAFFRSRYLLKIKTRSILIVRKLVRKILFFCILLKKSKKYAAITEERCL